MGQDREFTDDEKRYALNTIKTFIETWEKEERDSLTADRDHKIKLLSVDAQNEQEMNGVISEEMDKQIEELLSGNEELAADEELKELHTKQERLKQTAQLFLENDDWKKYVESIKNFRVQKMPRIIQSLLYLMGNTREDVCLPNSNCLDWKRTCHMVEKKLPTEMSNFVVLGEKKSEFKPY